MIAFCSVLSGIEDWVGTEDFAWERGNWFRGFLELPHDRLKNPLTLNDFDMFGYPILRDWVTTVFAIILIGGTLLWWWQRPNPVYQEQFLNMGTLVNITFYQVDSETAQKAIAEVKTLFHAFEQDLHPWRKGALMTLNQSLKNTLNQPVTVPENLWPLLISALALSKETEGFFNPAIGELIELWGFHQDDPHGPPPSQEAIAEWNKHPVLTNAWTLLPEKHQIISHHPHLRLDFGAYSKGYVLDQAIEILKKWHIENAIINIGGNLKALGQRGDRPWRIGIRHPRNHGILASIQLKSGEAVATSGDYERYYFDGEKRYAHILDPYIGYPVSNVQAVTILHASAAMADTSTAFVVAGPKRWQNIAKRLGIDQLLMVDEHGDIQVTDRLASRLTWVSESPKVTVVH